LGPKQLAIAIDHQVTPVVDTEGREDWIAALHQRRKDGCLGSLTDVDRVAAQVDRRRRKGTHVRSVPPRSDAEMTAAAGAAAVEHLDAMR